MLSTRPTDEQSASQGFILVTVLWIIGALATLAVIYSIYVTEVAYAFVDYDDRLRAQELATAGVELAAYALTADREQQPVAGSFKFRLGKAEVGVSYRAESARIDLNFAPDAVLAGLFAAVGASSNDARQLAERIIAWRTPTPDAADGEVARYRAAGRTYGPRRAPFQHVNEVALVLGMTPALVDRVLPYLTVYSGTPEVNVLVADAPVLAALPGVTPKLMDRLVNQRRDAPKDFLLAQVGMAAQFVTLQASDTNRVTVDVKLPSGRRSTTEAVVLLSKGDREPYSVLSWHDEVTK